MSLYTDHVFEWAQGASEPLKLTINNGCFRTIMEMDSSGLTLTCAVVVIASSSIPLFDDSLLMLSKYVTNDSILIVDSEMGIGLETRVFHSLPNVGCVNTCSVGAVDVIGYSKFTVKSALKIVMLLPSCGMNGQLSNFVTMLSKSCDVQIASTAEDFHDAAWSKCLKHVAFDVPAILFGENRYTRLVSENRIRIVVEDLIDEVAALASCYGAKKWSSGISQLGITSLLNSLALKVTDKAVNEGLENYLLALVFHFLLLSDTYGRHCPALESVYPMLVNKISPPMGTLSPTVESNNNNASADLDELQELFFDAAQIPLDPDLEDTDIKDTKYLAFNNYRDYDRPSIRTKAFKHNDSPDSSLDGMETLESASEFSIKCPPDKLKVTKHNHKTPMNFSGKKTYEQSHRKMAIGVVDRKALSEPLFKSREGVLLAMLNDGVYTTTTERYGSVSHNRTRRT